MYVLKVDLPTGRAFFTGKKKVVQSCEFPGLTEEFENAKQYETEEEAKKFCKMLIKKYDMDFYYSSTDEPHEEYSGEDDFTVSISEDLAKEIDAEFNTPQDEGPEGTPYYDIPGGKDRFLQAAEKSAA